MSLRWFASKLSWKISIFFIIFGAVGFYLSWSFVYVRALFSISALFGIIKIVSLLVPENESSSNDVLGDLGSDRVDAENKDLPDWVEELEWGMSGIATENLANVWDEVEEGDEILEITLGGEDYAHEIGFGDDFPTLYDEEPRGDTFAGDMPLNYNINKYNIYPRKDRILTALRITYGGKIECGSFIDFKRPHSGGTEVFFNIKGNKIEKDFKKYSIDEDDWIFKYCVNNGVDLITSVFIVNENKVKAGQAIDVDGISIGDPLLKIENN